MQFISWSDSNDETDVSVIPHVLYRCNGGRVRDDHRDPSTTMSCITFIRYQAPCSVFGPAFAGRSDGMQDGRTDGRTIGSSTFNLNRLISQTSDRAIYWPLCRRIAARPGDKATRPNAKARDLDYSIKISLKFAAGYHVQAIATPRRGKRPDC